MSFSAIEHPGYLLWGQVNYFWFTFEVVVHRQTFLTPYCSPNPLSVFLPDYESLCAFCQSFTSSLSKWENLCTLLQGQILLRLFLASIFSSLVPTMVKYVPVLGVSYVMYCSVLMRLSFFVYWASVREGLLGVTEASAWLTQYIHASH